MCILFLDMVRLCLTLWTLGNERQDNRSGLGKIESSAPLIPFLKRLEAIEPQMELPNEENHDSDPEDINDDSGICMTTKLLASLSPKSKSELSPEFLIS